MRGKYGTAVDDVGDVVGELIADEAVEGRGNMDAVGVLDIDQAALIAAGDAAEHLDGDRNAGILQRADQRARAEQMAGEVQSLRPANIDRAGAVVAEDDVAELSGDGALQDVLRHALVEGHDVAEPAVDLLHQGDGILVPIAEAIDDDLAINADLIRDIRE